MTDDTERAQVGWGFWLWWVLVSFVGYFVGRGVAEAVVFVVALTVFKTVDLVMTDGPASLSTVRLAGPPVAFFVQEVMFGAIVGASIGIAQWLVLRRRVSRAGWWVLATSVGFAVSLAVGFAVSLAMGFGEAMDFATGLVVVGPVVGITQWLLLRRRVSRAGWWVLATSVGFATGRAVNFAGVGTMSLVVPGAITGIAIVWLLRQSVTEEPSLLQDVA